MHPSRVCKSVAAQRRLPKPAHEYFTSTHPLTPHAVAPASKYTQRICCNSYLLPTHQIAAAASPTHPRNFTRNSLVLTLLSNQVFSYYSKNNIHHVTKTHAKKVLLQKQNGKCLMCKDTFSTKIPHELHHVDYNKQNNTLENLAMLCCNCHSSIHRYNASLVFQLDRVHILNILH